MRDKTKRPIREPGNAALVSPADRSFTQTEATRLKTLQKYTQISVYSLRIGPENSDGLRRIHLHQERTQRAQHPVCGECGSTAGNVTETTALKRLQVSLLRSELELHIC